MRNARLQRAEWALAALSLLATGVLVQARWRQPNSEYQARRAALRATVDGPVVLFGYTGREASGTLDRFFQEENFYYLTGYDYPGAALLLIPDAAGNAPYTGPHEILYLPPRDRCASGGKGPCRVLSMPTSASEPASKRFGRWPSCRQISAG